MLDRPPLPPPGLDAFALVELRPEAEPGARSPWVCCRVLPYSTTERMGALRGSARDMDTVSACTVPAAGLCTCASLRSWFTSVRASGNGPMAELTLSPRVCLPAARPAAFAAADTTPAKRCPAPPPPPGGLGLTPAALRMLTSAAAPIVITARRPPPVAVMPGLLAPPAADVFMLAG